MSFRHGAQQAAASVVHRHDCSTSAQPTADVTKHLALALSQYLRHLRRKGIHAPLEIETLTALLTELACMHNGASGPAPERRMPLNLMDDPTPAQHALTSERLLVTKKEASERLSVSVRTVERLAATGVLPQVQIGRLPRFRVSDLEAYVDGLGPLVDSDHSAH